MLFSTVDLVQANLSSLYILCERLILLMTHGNVTQRPRTSLSKTG